MQELRFIINFLKTSVPRTLVAGDTRKPLLIFTDAALENEQSDASIGAVVLNSSLGQHVEGEFFGEKLPSHL